MAKVYYSFAKFRSPRKKKGSEDKFNFELVRNEIDCTREGINDGENESSDGDSDIFFS